MKVVLAGSKAEAENVKEPLMAWGYEVIVASSGEDAWAKIREIESQKEPFMVVLDRDMPGMSGMEVCKHTKGLPTFIYVLIFAELNEDRLFEEFSRWGVDDYIIRPWSLPRLKWDMIKGTQWIEQRAKDLTDELTGLWNRQEGIRRLDIELSRSYRQKDMVGIVLLDLDRFKFINDNYGHDAGDLVLEETAQRIRGSIRQSDTAVRYGGDEFLLVLPDARNRELVEKTAKKIIRRISEDPVVLPLSKFRIRIAASLGAVLSSVETRSRAESLIGLADKAMYESKVKGSNEVTVVQFSEEV